MLIIISPAKTLDWESSFPDFELKSPRFLNRSTQLVEELHHYSSADLKKLMGISDALSQLNFERFQTWQPSHHPENARPAIFTYKGDVFQGIDMEQFSRKDLQRAQKHLRILSGLYGVLRPMDLIQPHRLEMGTKLKVGDHKNLYEFWGHTIHESLAEDVEANASNWILNLASQEYSQSAKLKSFNKRIISPRFLDFHRDKYKMISFFAKKARGLMTRYAIQQNISTPEELEGFNLEGYYFHPDFSKEDEPCFVRD